MKECSFDYGLYVLVDDCKGNRSPGAQAARSQFAHGWVRTIDDTELNCGNLPIADTTR
ncbi:hypothetical protein [Candidatus Mycobacterium methanotrophicum]|uniref:Uncharacterized protein n=1 Tax=Candidatus Mycobacterium methanotrophicum TaxID=2943498 RepID=A0ABY4QRW5_9MYCO|nr:hypothetical protein [Candidatus Mycobacterium methanotrophicum]UQX13414.1 hypothetical protein M5I08_24710 [Candidatus Mycobacterium methanotrophicum]